MPDGGYTIDIDTFTLHANPDVDHIKKGLTCSKHPVVRGTLQGDQRVWIRKELKHAALARHEVLCQSLLKILRGGKQPETRLAQNIKTGVYYVLSEEIKTPKLLPINQAGCSIKQPKGLGEFLLWALALQDIDLKDGNILVGIIDVVVGNDVVQEEMAFNVDGDWKLAQIRPVEKKKKETKFPYASHNYDITVKAIEQLPFPTDYFVWNWLDLIKEGKPRLSSQYVDESLVHSPQFREEVNRAIHRFCLLPDQFIELFVDAFIPAGGQHYIDLLKARRDALQSCALKIDSFHDYLETADAYLNVKIIVNEINMLTVNGVPYAYGGPDVLILNQAVRERSAFVSRGKVYFDCVDILSKIKVCPVSENDILLSDYIRRCERNIELNSNNPAELLSMKVVMSRTYDSVSSPEVLEVRQQIAVLRNRGFFSPGSQKKAAKTEEELRRTPLDKRQYVVTEDQCNAVQESLASHRHFWKKGTVYKTHDGKIDSQLAAGAFRNARSNLMNKALDSTLSM